MGIGIGEIRNPALKSLQAEEMLREEHDIHADKGDPEMESAQYSIIFDAPDFLKPVIEAGEDREHRPERQHIMEMGDHIIGVVQARIHRRVGQHNPGHAPHGEQKDKSDRPEHRNLEVNRSAPHGRDP